MKIGSKLQFEVPDQCPENCTLRPEHFFQGCMCTRCPVFVCMGPKTEEDKMYMPLVEPHDHRNDWAEEWESFFKTGKYPELRLMIKVDDE